MHSDGIYSSDLHYHIRPTIESKSNILQAKVWQPLEADVMAATAAFVSRIPFCASNWRFNLRGVPFDTNYFASSLNCACFDKIEPAMEKAVFSCHVKRTAFNAHFVEATRGAN